MPQRTCTALCFIGASPVQRSYLRLEPFSSCPSILSRILVIISAESATSNMPPVFGPNMVGSNWLPGRAHSTSCVGGYVAWIMIGSVIALVILAIIKFVHRRRRCRNQTEQNPNLSESMKDTMAKPLTGLPPCASFASPLNDPLELTDTRTVTSGQLAAAAEHLKKLEISSPRRTTAQPIWDANDLSHNTLRNAAVGDHVEYFESDGIPKFWRRRTLQF